MSYKELKAEFFNNDGILPQKEENKIVTYLNQCKIGLIEDTNWEDFEGLSDICCPLEKTDYIASYFWS